MIPAGAEAGKSTKNAIWNQTKKSVLSLGRVHASPAPEAALEGEFHLPEIKRQRGLADRAIALKRFPEKAWAAPWVHDIGTPIWICMAIPASLVIHAIRRKEAYFTKTKEGLQIADPVECLLDLHELRLEAQAAALYQSLEQGKDEA